MTRVIVPCGCMMLPACYLAPPPDPEIEDTSAASGTDVDTDPETDASTDTGPDPSSSVEATWCWTVAPVDKQLALLQVDMNAHTWVEVGRYGFDVPSSFHTQSIARIGDHLYMAGYFGGFEWADLDLASKTLTRTEYAPATSVLTDGTYLYSQPAYMEICQYDSWDDLVASKSTDCVEGFSHATRFTRSGSLVYGAWHSTSEVQVYDSSTGVELETIPLSDWDTWIWGMSVAGDMLHLIDDDRSDAYAGEGTRIARFDPETGELVDHTFIDEGLWASGLWCEEGAAP